LAKIVSCSEASTDDTIIHHASEACARRGQARRFRPKRRACFPSPRSFIIICFIIGDDFCQRPFVPLTTPESKRVARLVSFKY
jgi:hypothetical protein